MVLESKYLIELLTPKQKDMEKIEEKLEQFRNRYEKILDHGAVVSIPDNPLGNLHFTAMETIDYLDLPVDKDNTLIHLNTFHRKQDLENFLDGAKARDVKYLLVVSGDGSVRLPKLEPEQIGIDAKTVTSVELLDHINRNYDFVTGAAFNQYEPKEDEMQKLEKKLDSGAKFIITQPVMNNDEAIDELKVYLDKKDIPLHVGAWMSRNIKLLYDCIGTSPEDGLLYNPIENLQILHNVYGNNIYLSLLPFKKPWKELLPMQE